jgi:GDP-L-fucose synthase
MRVFLAGHRGMVGSAIFRQIAARGDHVITRSHAQLDLTDQAAVRSFMEKERPEAVILAAATGVGACAGAERPADVIYENMMMECNVIHQAHRVGVQRLLLLGSARIYPRITAQPIAEAALMTGPLDPLSEPYAISRIAGIKLCESYSQQFGRDYRSVVAADIYGPGDDFHVAHGRLLPTLLRRFHDAAQCNTPEVILQGSNAARHELLHVDDLAAACLFVMDKGPLPPPRTWPSQAVVQSRPFRVLRTVLSGHTPARWGDLHTEHSHINIGTGTDITTADLAHLIAKATGFTGQIRFDPSRLAEVPRRLMDMSRLDALGWQATIPLTQGIIDTYQRFLQTSGHLRAA